MAQGPIRAQRQSQGSERDQADLAPVGQAKAQANISQSDQALDAVLDDIESVLETNAEDYVKSFVQQGGQ
ncbi:ubiquitin-like protein Pup [Bifidobacterium aemilianum]|uniref:Prokaryotic ubiquitin-like protein Pup n=1 Tax=Bifidobacterium aemilianum TaxID=2493120 RepID=A0A366KBC6_9BIFI|nr:ubiquitin-like protein Pup [Bifidobacterium aemilianum]RBP98423.1 ubiquitin-like protein Pup [Bifidobacterium aemilianum]